MKKNYYHEYVEAKDDTWKNYIAKIWTIELSKTRRFHFIEMNRFIVRDFTRLPRQGQPFFVPHVFFFTPTKLVECQNKESAQQAKLDREHIEKREKKDEQYETIGERTHAYNVGTIGLTRIPYSTRREKPIEIDRGLFANTSYATRYDTCAINVREKLADIAHYRFFHHSDIDNFTLALYIIHT